MAIVEIHNLCKYYKIPKKKEGFLGAVSSLFSTEYQINKAVDSIDLQIEHGDIVGFLGPNGAGKSTTIKMMTGILKPTSGIILVNSNVPFSNRIVNAQNIGVVFGQRTQLWWDLPVCESFNLLREIYRLSKADFEENIALFNDLVNLKSLYNMPVRYLSLGQRMLCDIAASFLHNPKVIFLDEPTIGLDISIKTKIRNLIKDLNQRKGVTVILTTHDITDIEALCKKVIIIDKGKVIYDDSINNVNKLFGAYRTLRLDVATTSPEKIEEMKENILRQFALHSELTIDIDDNNWLGITFNQNTLVLLDLLDYIMKHYAVKDIKTEEMKTEHVIKRIYDGELQ